MVSLRLSVALPAACFLLAAGTAQAASLKLVDGGSNGGFYSGDIPTGAANDLLVPLSLSNPLSGWYGSAVQLVGSGYITAEYFGFEAGYRNHFNMNGSELFATTGGIVTTPVGTPLGTYTSAIENGGSGTLLDFSFDTNSDANTIVNGDENTGVRRFFASIVGASGATKGDSVWLFLDDSGAGPDDDFDDMAIRLSVTPVPLPAALPLLLAGIGGLGFMARRKKKAA